MFEPITQQLDAERETKNKYRFDANAADGPHAVENLYVKRWAMGDEMPDQVEITVRPVDGGD